MNEQSAAMNLSQVAERLDVSRRTIERLINAGSLRAFRIGRRRLVAAEELQAFVRRQGGQ